MPKPLLFNNYSNDSNMPLIVFTSSGTVSNPDIGNYSYTYLDTTNTNGTITRKIYLDDPNDSPTIISFYGSSGGNTTLISVDYFNKNLILDSTENMFGNCTNLKSVNFKNLDLSEVLYSSHMFYGCSSLLSVNLLSTNANLVEMYNIFCNCSSIQTIIMPNTSNGTDMGRAFYNCHSLTRIENLNVSSVTNYENIFYNCSSVSYVELLSSNYNTIVSIIQQLPTTYYNGTVDISKNSSTVISNVTYFLGTSYKGWTIKTY